MYFYKVFMQNVSVHLYNRKRVKTVEWNSVFFKRDEEDEKDKEDKRDKRDERETKRDKERRRRQKRDEEEEEIRVI